MSYHVHITRKSTNWAAKDDSATITQAEWEAYVVSDAEMRLGNQPEEPALIADITEMLHPDGLSIWLPYTKKSKADPYAWFYHDQDHVTVEGPDEAILGKMLAIAHALQARVQGDDGEYFDDPGQPYGLQPEDDGLAWPGRYQIFGSFRQRPRPKRRSRCCKRWRGRASTTAPAKTTGRWPSTLRLPIISSSASLLSSCGSPILSGAAKYWPT